MGRPFLSFLSVDLRGRGEWHLDYPIAHFAVALTNTDSSFSGSCVGPLA